MSAASNSEDRHMGGQSTNMLIPLPTCHITWKTVFSSVFPASQGAEVHSSHFLSVFTAKIFELAAKTAEKHYYEHPYSGHSQFSFLISFFRKMEPEMRWEMTEKWTACLFLMCFHFSSIFCLQFFKLLKGSLALPILFIVSPYGNHLILFTHKGQKGFVAW